MVEDGAGGGDPDIAARLRHHRQRAPQHAQPVRLADDVGVQRDAHHLRQAIGADLAQPFLEIIHDHPRKGLGRFAAGGDGGDVVDLLRIGHGQQRATARPHPDRGVIGAPVHGVAIAFLGQQVGRRAAFGDPGGQPAVRRGALVARNGLGRVGDQAAFLGLGQHRLAFGIGAAMAGHLVAARPMGGHQVWRVVVHRAVEQHGRGHRDLIQQVQQPPAADPVAIVAPGEVQHIRLRPAGGEFGAQPFPEGEMLQIDAEIDGELRPTRPGIGGAPPPGRVVVASMGRQHRGSSARIQHVSLPRPVSTASVR